MANLSASAYTSDHTSPERGKRLILAQSALGSRFGCPVFPVHLVWGYVSLTGIAAAVSPGFDPPKAVATRPRWRPPQAAEPFSLRQDRSALAERPTDGLA